jgi:hypothetical protein
MDETTGDSGSRTTAMIQFPDLNQAHVYIQTDLTNNNQQRMSECYLFAFFITWQVTLLGRRAADLSKFLLATELNTAYSQAALRCGPLVIFGTPAPERSVGFSASLDIENEALPFMLGPLGFGAKDKRLDYFAETATKALLFKLMDRRSQDARLHMALAGIACIIGSLGRIKPQDLRPIVDRAIDAAWATVEELLPYE